MRVALRPLYTSVVSALRDAGVESPTLDARMLLEHFLGAQHVDILAGGAIEADDEQLDTLDAALQQRAEGVPVAKIIGSKWFWNSQFITNRHTLDPRPESELIIEATLELFPDKGSVLRILDLGTGTGCLALSLLLTYHNANVVMVDSCPHAMDVARRNIDRLECEGRAKLVRSNWHMDLREDERSPYDVIISNPPYIRSGDIAGLRKETRHDPDLALDGGDDGLSPYHIILPALPQLLKRGGYVIFEIGAEQEEDVLDIAQQTPEMEFAYYKKDLAGHVRTLIFRRM